MKFKKWKLSDGPIISVSSHLQSQYLTFSIENAWPSFQLWVQPGDDLHMNQRSGEGSMIRNLFQGRQQFTAGISAVNIEPNQLGICSVLFMAIFGDNQTQIYHTHATNSTYNAKTKIHNHFLLLSLNHLYTPTLIHPHTQTDERTHTLKAQRSMQVE